MIEEIEREGLSLTHLRSVPTNPDCLGEGSTVDGARHKAGFHHRSHRR